jgi:hypothetical protein
MLGAYTTLMAHATANLDRGNIQMVLTDAITSLTLAGPKLGRNFECKDIGQSYLGIEEHLSCLTTPLTMLSVDSFLIQDVLTLPSKAKRIDSIAGTEFP